MGYRAGIGSGRTAMFFGLSGPCNPHIYCDGCGLVYEFKNWPPAWFLNRKAWFLNRKPKPGWKLIRYEDAETGAITRQDYCPQCKGAVK